MKIGIREVAKAAGVSIGTVSKVFNDDSNLNIRISDATRDRVLAAARQLSYNPNYGAKLLRGMKSYTVGFSVEAESSIENHLGSYSVELLNGIREIAAKHSYQVLLINDTEYLKHFRTGRIDALVCSGFHRQERDAALLDEYRALQAADKPFVIINGCSEQAFCASVSVDNAAGIHQVLELIRRKHYRRVGFLGELGRQEQKHHLERMHLLQQELTSAGLEADPRRFIHGAESGRTPLPRTGNYVYLDGYLGMRELFERGPDVDCVVCGNDSIAIGAIRYCLKNRIAIPGQVAIVGFDGAPESEFITPAITTVSQPLRAMGRQAFEILLAGLDDPTGYVRKVLMTPTLLERESA